MFNVESGTRVDVGLQSSLGASQLLGELPRCNLKLPSIHERQGETKEKGRPF